MAVAVAPAVGGLAEPHQVYPALSTQVALGGAGLELAARRINPAYQRTVVQHEAGHFLCAYLLGCPIEACILDPLAVARDRRVAGAAGTIFFDPLLAQAMRSGAMPRSSIDRYSVVVMGGIAAEAVLNGRAEGGRSDEEGLIRLLGSLDGGKSFDFKRVQNQARWGASGAALILRAHRPALDALIESLAAGQTVGECIMAIEEAIAASPLLSPPPAPEAAAKVVAGASGPAAGAGRQGGGAPDVAAPQSREEIAQRLKQVEGRSAEVAQRIKELEGRGV